MIINIVVFYISRSGTVRFVALWNSQQLSFVQKKKKLRVRDWAEFHLPMRSA